MKKTRMLPLALMLITGLLSAAASQAAAAAPRDSGQAATHLLPFKGTLEGLHISRTPVDPPVVFDRFEMEGEATQLGRFALVVEATVDFGLRPVIGVGTYTFTAANGDQLVATHTGFSTLVGPGSVLITEEATIDPSRSTGRFAGAEGTFVVERLADAATGVGGVTSGTFTGTIAIAAR